MRTILEEKEGGKRKRKNGSERKSCISNVKKEERSLATSYGEIRRVRKLESNVTPYRSIKSTRIFHLLGFCQMLPPHLYSIYFGIPPLLRKHNRQTLKCLLCDLLVLARISFGSYQLHCLALLTFSPFQPVLLYFTRFCFRFYRQEDDL